MTTHAAPTHAAPTHAEPATAPAPAGELTDAALRRAEHDLLRAELEHEQTRRTLTARSQ